MLNMLTWRKSKSTMASELKSHIPRIRADFLVGHQCNQKLNAFTPLLSQSMKTFYFLTILLQSYTNIHTNLLGRMCNLCYILLALQLQQQINKFDFLTIQTYSSDTLFTVSY